MADASSRPIGLIVNPVAGIGGRAGLRGSDSQASRALARQRGGRPRGQEAATKALAELAELRDELRLLTGPGDMGESAANACNLNATPIGSVHDRPTTAVDTRLLARQMVERGVSLIAFAGGDGTAVDILESIDEQVPVVGLPAGVKMHSSVFGITPQDAGQLIRSFVLGESSGVERGEVIDLDESALARGVLSPRFHGYLATPSVHDYRLQSAKVRLPPSAKNQVKAIAETVIKRLSGTRVWILGPGSTTGAVLDALSLEQSLLGVDVVSEHRLLAAGVSERELLALLGSSSSAIVVSPIGGQGFVFGRGNQQLTPSVIRAVGLDNILIIASEAKLASLEGRPLLVDTGDELLDAQLAGYRRIIVGRNRDAMYPMGDVTRR